MNEDNELSDDESKIQALGGWVSRLAQEQVGIRQLIEERWLSDLERYMGKYDAGMLERLKQSGGSQAFVNITRSKTAAAEARLQDMLFPSDDRNWGIQPSPVPELIAQASNHEQVTDEQGMEQGYTYAQQAEVELREARDKAKLMANEIQDQLLDTKYHQIARDVIHDACLFGTGILKGPIVISNTRKKWSEVADGVHEVDMVDEFRPGVEHIKIWDFFPDMSSPTMDDAGFTFERRYMTKKGLIELAGRDGYITENIKRLISVAPSAVRSGGTHIAKIRELSGLSVSMNENRYEMWEYHGPVDKDELLACGCDINEEDSLQQYDAVIVVINNTVIKADINPMETNERIYSAFNYEEDDTSIFGFGVPFLLENEQRIGNAAWRMVLDNAALSTGGQIVVNRELVTPSDGAWDLKARKVWFANDVNVRVQDVFGIFEIPSHQAELTEIFSIARDMADDVTSLPMLAQGEQGSAPDTAKGTSILMNSANIVLRRIVKSFDDGITKPFISRMYDWNMQNSKKSEIKGDYEVDARGSSTLMVKETQTQALMEMMAFSQQPAFEQITKHAELYRKVAQANHILPDEVIKTDEEIKAEQANNSEAQQQQKLQAEMLRLQVVELQSKIDKLGAETVKTKAQAVGENVKTQFAGVQTGQAVLAMPPVLPVADELMLSAGYEDKNGFPLASIPEAQEINNNVIDSNTDPRFPVAPESPVGGVNQGIETMEGEAV